MAYLVFETLEQAQAAQAKIDSKQILGQSRAEELGIYPVSEIDVQTTLNQD